MILEFGFKNFFSFKEGCTISFELDGKCPPSISKNKSFTPVLCLKGGNASGKTQVLKALSFIKSFITQSFARDPESLILLEPFYYSEEPSSFYVKFISDETTYLYELEATENEVLREGLYRVTGKRVVLLEREKTKLTKKHSSMKKLEQITLRTNASVISTARQYELGITELNSIHAFFANVLSNVSYSGMSELKLDVGTVAGFLAKQESTFDFVKKFITECDTGVTDIYIHESKTADGQTTYHPMFIHDVDGELQAIHADLESSGTKALFVNLPGYKIVLAQGGVLALDELDINLHPHILPKIIDLFLNAETNPLDAQLIFTTHNSEIMDQLGRYRTYLVNKVSNQSYAYRLDEISGDILRNDRPVLHVYNSGKIGGVPNL